MHGRGKGIRVKEADARAGNSGMRHSRGLAAQAGTLMDGETKVEHQRQTGSVTSPSLLNMVQRVAKLSRKH